MTGTELAKVKSWTTPLLDWNGQPRDEDEWPYPTRHTVYAVEGVMAGRLRKALGVDDVEAEVTITEVVTSGGYSEYTQENGYEMTVECAGESKAFEGYTSVTYDGEPVNFFAWLDAAAPLNTDGTIGGGR